MARKKADIEKDWVKVQKSLDDVLKTILRSPDFEAFETRLDTLVTAWASWKKLLAEAEAKIKEKDWNVKKLDADRQKFKDYVAEQGKAESKYQTQLNKVQVDFTEKVKQNKDALVAEAKYDKVLKKILADFKSENDASAAVADLEKLTDDLSQMMKENELPKAAVFKSTSALFKAATEALSDMEKEQRQQLKVTGEVNKMTYESIKADPKLYQAYCTMAKQPAHFAFMKATNYGAKGDAAIYKKYIVTNSVNVSRDLLVEFEAFEAEENWPKALWGKVAGQIDGMLSDARHVQAFKQKLLDARL